MKVLEPGRPQRGWATETTCTGHGNGGGGCGAKLLVEEGDLYETKSCDYTGDCDYYTTFRCPCCDVETDLTDVPYAVTARIRQRPHRTSSEK